MTTDNFVPQTQRSSRIETFSRRARISCAVLVGILAGCGAPAPEIDRDPPQFFTAPRAHRDALAPVDTAVADGPVRRVLFIGNSYTESGDMPGLVSRLASTARRGALHVERNTMGGGTLEAHYQRPGVLEAIRDGNFDFVVLQGRFYEPILEPDRFRLHAHLFAEAIWAAGAMPVFFETWAHEAGDPVYQDPAFGGDPRGMQALVRQAYQRVAEETGGLVAPVGDAWERAAAEPMPPDLYSDDPGHPDHAGTYLTACVFYGVLTGHRARGNSALHTLIDPPLAGRLQSIADRVVFGE